MILLVVLGGFLLPVGFLRLDWEGPLPEVILGP